MASVALNAVLDQIVNNLFVAERRRLDAILTDVCNQNQEIYHEQLDGFMFQGFLFRKPGLPHGMPCKKVLHPNLAPIMDNYLIDNKTMVDDRQMIKQVLFNLIVPCKSLQDLRDALPNSLTDTLGDLQKLARHNDEAYTIKDDERAMRRYQKILPKIEFYSAVRLIY